MRKSRSGTTLAELLIALVIISIVGAFGMATSQRTAARRAVLSAGREAEAAFATATRNAIATSRPTAIRLNAATHELIVYAGSDTIQRLQPEARHGVTFTSTRDSMAYDANGLGVGAANLTLRLIREPAAETLVVSRLGRVRR